MTTTNKKGFALLLTVGFIVFNLLHIIFPIWLIVEDIQAGTVIGTGIELAVLFPWMIEAVSVLAVIGQGIYYIAFRKIRYFDLPNFILFVFYIIQVILFNVLLRF